MDFQVVLLAGGTSRNLAPLVSKEVPKAFLPVANRPVLSYVLEQLELSNLNDIIVVVEGQEAALRVGPWISGSYADRLRVEVEMVPEDIGTAGALRSIAHLLTAKDVLVVSGDLVSDVPVGAVAATHRQHDAAITAMFCAAPVTGLTEAGSSATKDKVKKPRCYNIIGLDKTRQFLLYVATGSDVEKDIRMHKNVIRAVGQMEIRADYMDAHLYAFNRSILIDVLSENENFHSLRQDVLPYLVSIQLKQDMAHHGGDQVDENGHEKSSAISNQTVVARILSNASVPTFYDYYASRLGSSLPSKTVKKCCVYIASSSNYCARLNSIQAYHDVNRDVIGDANHLSGYTFSAHNNIIDSSAQLGLKSTVGPYCMVGEGSQLNDKCSIKRSVIGRHCRIGSNVKIVNSVVMNYVTVGDGCSIQNSVICSNVQLQERVTLKDCQVGTGYVVTAGGEHKGESLARKEK